MRKFKKAPLSRALIWSFGLLALVTILAFILPRKGFDFTDHGYYLYSSFLMSHYILPTEGNAYLLYAMFIKLGVWNYYFFELVYFLFLGSAVTTLWTSFKSIKESYFLPFALVIALSSNYTYMMSYQHAPICFLMMGFGLLFHALKKNSRILCVLASLCLGYGATTNISLFPTAVTTGILISLLVHNSRIKKTFHMSYWVTAAAFIVFSIVSRLSFFELNSDPRFAMDALLAKVPQYIWFLIKTDLVVVFSLILLPFIKSAGRRSKLLMAVLVFSLLFQAGNAWYHLDHHHGAQQAIIDLTVFYSYFVALIYVCYFKRNNFFLKTGVFLVAVFSYGAILSIATLGGFASHMSFIAPACVTAGCLILELYSGQQAERKYLIAIMMLFSLISLVFFSRYTYRSYPLFGEKTFMTGSNMFGVAENKAKIDMIEKIAVLYGENHCENKVFVVYPSLPILYYYFHRDAPLHQPWLSDSVGYVKEKEMISMLQAKKNWCVITAPGFNHAPINYFSGVNQFLKKHSTKIESIKSIGSDRSNTKMPNAIVFYMR